MRERTELLDPPDSQKRRYQSAQLMRIPTQHPILTTARAMLASGESPLGIDLTDRSSPVLLLERMAHTIYAYEQLTCPPTDGAPKPLMHGERLKCAGRGERRVSDVRQARFF